jgi:hypothetical protein
MITYGTCYTEAVKLLFGPAHTPQRQLANGEAIYTDRNITGPGWPVAWCGKPRRL